MLRKTFLHTTAASGIAGSLPLLGGIGGLGGRADAAQNVTIKLAIETGPGSPYYVGAQAFAKTLEGIDSGMQVQVFPNGQLGAEKDVLEGLKLGTVQMTVTGDSDLIAPESGVFALPFLFANRPEAYKVLDSAVGKRIFAQTEQQGVKTLGIWDGGFRYVMSNKPINSIADLKGLKIRVPPLPVYVQTFAALGCNPTPMAFSQVYTALQQHTVDGVENSAPVLLTSKFGEVAKYLAVTRHVYTVAIIAIGEGFFNSLTPKQQAHVLKAAEIATASERKASAELESRDLKAIQGEGVSVTRPDLAPFRQAVKGLYASYEQKYRDDMAAIIRMIG